MIIAGRPRMLDVETPDQRNRCRGSATTVCAAFIADTLDCSTCPLRKARLDNVAAPRVVEKLGFIEDESYPVYPVNLGQWLERRRRHGRRPVWRSWRR